MCTPHNSSVKSPTPLRITEMTCNFRYHLIVEMMQYISVQCIWDRQPRRKLVLFSIPDQSTLPSPVCFVTMRPLVTTSLRNMTHYPADLCRETRRIEMQDNGLRYAQVGVKQNPLQGFIQTYIWISQASRFHLVRLYLHSATEDSR
jgi:hypothetical protein